MPDQTLKELMDKSKETQLEDLIKRHATAAGVSVEAFEDKLSDWHRRIMAYDWRTDHDPEPFTMEEQRQYSSYWDERDEIVEACDKAAKKQ
jgi:hypothetical protein